MKTKKLTTLSMLTAIALTIFMVEAQIPPLTPIPGIKMGLSNIVTVFIVFAIGPKEAAAVLFVRVFLGAVFAGLVYVAIAMIVKKYRNVDIGKALLISDVAVVIAACFVFGVETGMFSSLGLVMKTLVVDMVIESINLNKFFTIVTTKPDEIVHYIHEDLHRGATIEEAEGSFTHEKKYVILTATKRQQAVALRTFVRKKDPHAFIMITNSSEIVGKGFMRI